MPDLQSELSKLANAWDTHEQTIRQPQTKEKVMQVEITGSVSKDTFNFIHNNPNKYTPQEVIQHLKDAGLKSTSVSALITQMKRNGMVTTSATGQLSTTILDYKPIRNPYPKHSLNKPKKAKRRLTQAHTASGIAALTPVPQVNSVWDAETALANLSVKDAHALWVELNKMFGGK